MILSSLNTTTEPLMADNITMCEDGDNQLGHDSEIDDDNIYDYYDKKLNEELDSFEKTMTTFITINQKPGCSEEEEETNNLKRLFEKIIRVQAVITSFLAHIGEGSEMSQVLRVGIEGMNTWLYKAAAAAVNTDAGCFIREGLLKIVQVMNEEEEEEEDRCAICLDGMKSGDVRGRIQHCYHSFHFVCLNRWMKRMHTCPICRYEMDENHQLFINGVCNDLFLEGRR